MDVVIQENMQKVIRFFLLKSTDHPVALKNHQKLLEV